MTPPDAPVLAVRGVVKRWPRRPHPVLDGVSLLLGPGHAAWVGGDNGAGKTTLLRVVTGLLEPDAGSVEVCGLRPVGDRLAYQRRVGQLTAGNSGLYARLTVRQHLELWARVTMVPRPDRAEAIARAQRTFDLDALSPMRVDRISMGQRQRVRAAMAFLPADARLLLLDEPDTSLDPPGITLVRGAVAEHRRQGGAVVWCSPTPPEDVRFSLRLRLGAGRLALA